METPAHQAMWNESAVLASFIQKKTDQFFRSEHVLLEQVERRVSSVLDIGCAAGHFSRLLSEIGFDAAYTGIDVSEEFINAARHLYPQHCFYCGDATTYPIEGSFDLVNATGVFQHEPRFTELLQRMVALSNRYVLFDVKFANVQDHLIDYRRSYCTLGNSRAFFICLSYDRFIESLHQLSGVGSATLFGYETRPNAITVVPPEVLPLRSYGVLLEKQHETLQPFRFVDVSVLASA